ncbi:hypothetical protein L5515_005612 [Caenorhabditis briggsae]|uniref:Uncharacterized protein n=1 Tax=Caenorhabditis briggsae TaxID=6238 RepID=A0AAE9EQ82_CAEBR|nr:hypothetical protein L5515_005612 [Caenorhabditis briggsae]
MTNTRRGQMNNLHQDQKYFTDAEFIGELEANLDDDDGHLDRFNSTQVPAGARRFAEVPDISVDQCISRPRLTNTFMLKGLVERSQHYNKTIDRRVMTGRRIAFGAGRVWQQLDPNFQIAEEEQLKSGRGEHQETTSNQRKVLGTSCQNIPKRGRGDCFGRLRSADFEDGVSPTGPSTQIFPNSTTSAVIADAYKNNNFQKPSLNRNPTHTTRFGPTPTKLVEHERVLAFQSPRRFESSRLNLLNRNDRDTSPPPEVPAKHHFNLETAYNGKITPNFRFNYNPLGAIPCTHSTNPAKLPATVAPGFAPFQHISSSPSGRFGQRYPKRPDNIPQLPSQPKHLNHNYYQIELYGATQEERIAQRIEKTVRQTETPLRRF